MWRHHCVYNPSLGDEETVDEQILSSFGETDFVKLIGLSQGIAELAYAFGESPARFFDAGKGNERRIVIIVPLVNDEERNWRHGYWFAGELVPNAGIVELATYRTIELAFKQHCLFNGRNLESKEYWAKFTDLVNELTFSCVSLMAPNKMIYAPGRLNPSIENKVLQLAKKNGAVDLLITTEEGAVYGGGVLPFDVRREIIRFLNKPKQSKENVAGSSWNLFKYVHVPAMPLEWWTGDTKDEKKDSSPQNVEIYNDNEKLYLSTWVEGMYTYALVFPSHVDLREFTDALLGPLCSEMEGFSFAFAPPVKFYYMVLHKDSVVSTFPETQNETFLTLLNEFPDDQQVIRLGTTWLYFTPLSNGAKVVFGKKNVNSGTNFLGSLHNDVEQWIKDYERTNNE